MSLEIKWNRSPWWYARFLRDGRRISVRLDVRVQGIPPASRKLADRGDDAFESSRAKAQLRSEHVLQELDSSQSEELLLRRIQAARTRRKKLPKVALSEGYDRWAQIPRERHLSVRVLAQMKSLWLRWTEHVRSVQPAALNLCDVSTETAQKFLMSENARGLSNKSYNNILTALRGVYNMLAEQATIISNPFGKIPKRTDDTRIGRVPFSVDDLSAILEAADSPKHETVIGVVKVGICTAMRLGDCCRLRWDSVDLKAGFVRVSTSKTGETAEIPLLPLLEQAVRAALPQRGEYVFPEAAAMYATNQDGIIYRVQRLFADAGFFDSTLNPDKTAHRGDIRKERRNGLRRACLRGFHSFRITWVTLAMNAGIAVGLIQRVTSHRTVRMVEELYYKPQREHFRRALQDKLPHLSTLAGIAADPLRQLLEHLKRDIDQLSAQQRRRLRTELLAILDGQQDNVASRSEAL